MQKFIHTEKQAVLLALLRQARERRGITQVQLAASIGMPQSDISKVERGVRRLDVLELRTWLAGLGVGLVEFAQDLEQALGALESRAGLKNL